MEGILISQATIRKACEQMDMPISNQNFWYHKKTFKFPAPEYSSLGDKYVLYKFDTAIELIDIWLKYNEMEVPRDFIIDKLSQLVNNG